MKFIGQRRSMFKPEYISDSVADIDFNELHKKGIRAALIDLDGTVVERANYDVNPKISSTLKTQPLDIYIATNRPKSRDLKDLKERLHAKGVIHPKGIAGKPFKKYYTSAVKETGLKASQTVMIGDRFIQDIIGANSAGLHTVIVKKLDKPTNTFDKLLSATERKIISKISENYLD